MGANIALGSSLAKLKEEFSKENLKRGLMKALMIISGLLLMLGCAYLNQDMIIASINNNNVTLLEAMKYLFTTGIMVYGIMDIGKLGKLLGLSTKVENPVTNFSDTYQDTKKKDK